MWRKIKHVVATCVRLTHEARPPETQSGDPALWGNVQLVLGSNGEIIHRPGSSLQVEGAQVAEWKYDFGLQHYRVGTCSDPLTRPRPSCEVVGGERDRFLFWGSDHVHLDVRSQDFPLEHCSIDRLVASDIVSRAHPR